MLRTFASVYGMAQKKVTNGQARSEPDQKPGERPSSAEVAARHRAWLQSLPDDAPDMSHIGPDGNLYYDDDASFWRGLVPHR